MWSGWPCLGVPVKGWGDPRKVGAACAVKVCSDMAGGVVGSSVLAVQYKWLAGFDSL